MPVSVRSVEHWVAELGELVSQHVRTTNEKISALEARIIDLEGHIEHGPDGTCGVCASESETVGAVVYRADQDFLSGLGQIFVSESETECFDPFCGGPILVGDSMVKVQEGKYSHVQCFNIMSGDGGTAHEEMTCAHSTCFVPIKPGDAIVFAGTGHSGHNEWRHRDH